MLVRRKYIVQKSFRIDEQIENDLSILAQLTERSQNELVNVAITELLQDNKYYFLNVAVLEHFRPQFESAEKKLKPFELGGLRVEIEYCDNYHLKVRTIVKENDNILEDHTHEFESDISDEFEEYINNLYIHINSSASDTKKYLEERTDYRDYIKIRK